MSCVVESSSGGLRACLMIGASQRQPDGARIVSLGVVWRLVGHRDLQFGRADCRVQKVRLSNHLLGHLLGAFTWKVGCAWSTTGVKSVET